MADNMLLLRYGEIHLKGLNRPFFEQKLLKSIRVAIAPFDASLECIDSRYYVAGYASDREQELIGRLRRVFGLHSISPARCCEKDKTAISDLAEQVCRAQIARQPSAKTFKIRARRSDKRFPLNSMQLAAEVGGDLLDRGVPLSVDVHNPDILIDVEVRDKAYVYCGSTPAWGGMPTGTGGKALSLLSGGIDSPVATFMMARRGMYVDAVYYESVPYTGDQARQKVIDLAALLAGYCGRIRLHIVHFTDIQRTLYTDCPQGLLTVLMRRFMMRIAARIAAQNDCAALVTGESLGQVASQTMEAIACTDAAAPLPVLRPLIGCDKSEIMDRARAIGTYDISILPYEDCCTVFVPKHPTTRPKLNLVEQAEALLDIDGMIDAALSRSRWVDVNADGVLREGRDAQPDDAENPS